MDVSSIASFAGRIALILGLVALLNAGPVTAAPEQAEQQKIEYLIVSIDKLPNALFVRNGIEYDAPKAAAHLRMKLQLAGNKIKTAEDFIMLCATKSSMSGVAYEIKFADGRVVESAKFLRSKLVEYGSTAAQTAPH